MTIAVNSDALASDLLNEHNADGSHKAAALASMGYVYSGGWFTDSDTWVYVSASSFKIAGKDVTSKFPVGTKICLTQTTAKYFYVTAVAYSTDTTVTINAGSDYTLANAAITLPKYSYDANANGFPDWFNFAGSVTGFSSTTKAITRYRLTGRTITMAVELYGTSNATSIGLTAPITSANISGAGQYHWTSTGPISDNGALSDIPGFITIDNNSTSVRCFKGWATSSWTNTNAKGITATLTYEI